MKLLPLALYENHDRYDGISVSLRSQPRPMYCRIDLDSKTAFSATLVSDIVPRAALHRRRGVAPQAICDLYASATSGTSKNPIPRVSKCFPVRKRASQLVT